MGDPYGYDTIEWRRLTNRLKDAADWTCQECGLRTAQCQTHHDFYIRGHMAWDYPPIVLVVLCPPCHLLAGTPTAYTQRDYDMLKRYLAYLYGWVKDQNGAWVRVGYEEDAAA